MEIPIWELGLWLGFWMIFAHALGDYVFQGDTMAVEKNRHLNGKTGVPWYYWMLAHAVIHGGLVGTVAQSAVLGFAETICHFVIDILKCEKLIGVHTDQLGHILCKVVWICLVLGAR